MDALDFARWQFGATTVFHFLFVPLSIGLSAMVAVMHTRYYRTGDETYRRMTKFWGKLFLINFALGVVTGIVQEFQFGMNWSSYSRYVGDIFGAPLAIEGLLAFFLESTFIGLWIFGWDRLPKRVHLASIWLVAIGTQLSAAFILGANAWMQHPVGYEINETAGRAEMNDFFALLTNSTLIVSFFHTIFAAFVTAGMFVLAVSAFQLLRKQETEVFARSARTAMVVLLISSIGVAFAGHTQAQIMTDQQPMKMAAAEALWDTEDGASFSLLTIGNLDGDPVWQIRVPNLLSVLATNTTDGRVEGMNDIEAQYQETYGEGSYTPVPWITYWTFRLMVGAGFVMLGIAAYGLYLMRRNRLETSRRFLWIAVFGLALPYIANSTGWIFTEMGRQPWLVFGLLRTGSGVSPTVSGATVLISMVGFVLVYSLLALVGVRLMSRTVKGGAEKAAPPPSSTPALIY